MYFHYDPDNSLNELGNTMVPDLTIYVLIFVVSITLFDMSTRSHDTLLKVCSSIYKLSRKV